jgi:hypothetical protein
MTVGSNAMPGPSASGARLAGDDLQHLIGWYWALKTLRSELNVESVTLETLGAGNLDDVVVRASNGEPPEFWQVKATTAATQAVTSEWLMSPLGSTGNSLLQRFWTSYMDLRSRHGYVRLVLATNRTLDTADPVLKCRDGNELLAAILRQKSNRTYARKGLRTWADHVGVAEADLLEMLDVLRFRTDVTESSFRERITDITRLIGLRSDEGAILEGIGVIRSWIKSSRAPRTSEDVLEVVEALNLRVAPQSGLLVIQALRPVDDQDATASIDWIDRFVGDEARSRRGLKDPTAWNGSLLSELRAEIERIRADYDRVAVRGEARLPIWFATGSELSEVAGAVVSTIQNGDVWASDAAPASSPELVVTDARRFEGSGSELAISIAIADDPTTDASAYLEREVPSVGHAVTITLATGPNSRSIRDAGEAVALARGIRDEIRSLCRTSRPPRLHLFLAMPHGLALILGHLWDRMPPTQLYEDLTGSAYQPAFLVSNTQRT